MVRQTQLFILGPDEEMITRELQIVRPSVKFLDDNVWDGNEPVSQKSINMCKSAFVYVWDPKAVFPLPTIRRPDGKLEGPNSGVVVQIVRCILGGDVLRSGRVAAGTDGLDSVLNVVMSEFAREIWNVLRKFKTSELVAIDPSSRLALNRKVSAYWAGPAAVKWVGEDANRVFKDRSTEVYFLPKDYIP